ncbi:MAG: hypothetical protein AMDU5_GPLC00012G0012 [Thermoplasmatales archaeon Gpl]|nr:MAG: hypothetical protein AMDU5_GPLC00012G0012 [Thermoplasmatales archaeon Gpl]
MKVIKRISLKIRNPKETLALERSTWKYGKLDRWVLFLFISFSVIYSSISYLRYLSFSENVYDLGVNASLAYNVIYGQTVILDR